LLDLKINSLIELKTSEMPVFLNTLKTNTLKPLSNSVVPLKPSLSSKYDSDILRFLYKSVRKKRSNYITFTTGLPGSGKSIAAISKAIKLDVIKSSEGVIDNWSFNKLVFNAKDFIKAVNKNKRYSYIIWDDAGEMLGGANARKFWEETNLLISSLFQIMRFKNQWIDLTMPLTSFFDAQARRLIHATHMIRRRSLLFSYGSFYQHKFLTSTNKIDIYFKRLRTSNEFSSFIINSVKIPLPAPEIIKEYREISESQKSDWLKLYAEKIDELKAERMELERNLNEKIESLEKRVLDNVDDFVLPDGKLSPLLIQAKTNCSRELANFIARKLKPQINSKELSEKQKRKREVKIDALFDDQIIVKDNVEEKEVIQENNKILKNLKSV